LDRKKDISKDMAENRKRRDGRKRVDKRAKVWETLLSGFTLIEVLMTIVVLAILAAVAVPGFSVWLPKYQLKAAARDVVSNFQLAKMGAIKNNRAWGVVFDPGVNPGRYYLCSDPGANGNWEGPAGDDTVEKAVDLASYQSGVDYGHGDATKKATSDGGPFPDPYDDISFIGNVATFSPKGTVTRVGYVYLSNRRGASCAVGAPSTAGVIVLKRWTGSEWE
jgi:prepilin-type N-terminal cleavage/methylation domain-containing protein